MRKLSIMIISLIMAIFSGLPAHAQEPVNINTLRVDIWPEFDRPSVLVIYHISLEESTALPTILNIRVPNTAEVNAVATLDEEQNLLNATYSQTTEGKWEILAIETSSLNIQIEYYEPLVKDGSKRHISYEWPGDFNVRSFSVLVQVPAGATDFLIDPPAATSRIDQYDLLIYETETISLFAGEPYTMTASYEKADAQLSISSMPVQPVSPLEDTGGQVIWNDVLPWILGGLGLILIVLGLLVLFGFIGGSGWRIRRGAKEKYPRHPVKQKKLVLGSDDIHCQECGRLTQAGDLYCRSCGTRLRVD